MCAQDKNHVLFGGTKILQHTADKTARIRYVPSVRAVVCIAHVMVRNGLYAPAFTGDSCFELFLHRTWCVYK